jgi:hypothetical protein
VALDHHEAGRRLRHLGEAIAVGVLADAGLAVFDRIERVVRIPRLADAGRKFRRRRSPAPTR